MTWVTLTPYQEWQCLETTGYHDHVDRWALLPLLCYGARRSITGFRSQDKVRCAILLREHPVDHKWFYIEVPVGMPLVSTQSVGLLRVLEPSRCGTPRVPRVWGQRQTPMSPCINATRTPKLQLPRPHASRVITWRPVDALTALS